MSESEQPATRADAQIAWGLACIRARYGKEGTGTGGRAPDTPEDLAGQQENELAFREPRLRALSEREDRGLS